MPKWRRRASGGSAGVTGSVTQTPSNRPLADIAVSIGGLDAQALFAGSTPGLIAGVLVGNAVVPLNAATGSEVRLVLHAGEQQSQAWRHDRCGVSQGAGCSTSPNREGYTGLTWRHLRARPPLRHSRGADRHHHTPPAVISTVATAAPARASRVPASTTIAIASSIATPSTTPAPAQAGVTTRAARRSRIGRLRSPYTALFPADRCSHNTSPRLICTACARPAGSWLAILVPYRCSGVVGVCVPGLPCSHSISTRRSSSLICVPMPRVHGNGSGRSSGIWNCRCRSQSRCIA